MAKLPPTIVLTHFQRGPIRVQLWCVDSDKSRQWRCLEHPQYGLMPECLFKETREQINELLGELAPDPSDAISPYTDGREESFADAFLRHGRA